MTTKRKWDDLDTHEQNYLISVADSLYIGQEHVAEMFDLGMIYLPELPKGHTHLWNEQK